MLLRWEDPRLGKMGEKKGPDLLGYRAVGMAGEGLSNDTSRDAEPWPRWESETVCVCVRVRVCVCVCVSGVCLSWKEEYY